MSATFGQYLSRNEYTPGVDSLVNVIELGHTSSLVRPLGNNNWQILDLWFRVAISGSPVTGNMSASYFFGLCSGNKRYSATQGSTIGTHCIGFFAESSPYTRSVLLTPASDARMTPNTYAFLGGGTAGQGYMATGSVVGGSVSYRVPELPRIETQVSSSMSGSRAYLYSGNNFAPFVIRIDKSNPASWTIKGGKWTMNSLPITASTNIALNAYKFLCGGSVDVTTTSRDMLGAFVIDCYSGLATDDNNLWNTSMATTTVLPNTASFGDFDNINVYWSSTSHPNAKLLIKDIMVVRYQ